MTSRLALALPLALALLLAALLAALPSDKSGEWSKAAPGELNCRELSSSRRRFGAEGALVPADEDDEPSVMAGGGWDGLSPGMLWEDVYQAGPEF